MLIGSSASGFTLIEVMLSTVMMLVVSGAIYQLLFTTQRLSRAQSERIALQSTVRGAALVVANELRELSTVQGGSPTQNDILSLGAHAISYRATRGFGYACQTPEGNLIRMGRSRFSGHRDPQAHRDSALVYIPGGPGAVDSGWTPVGITNVSTATACAGAVGAGITLAVSSPAPLGTLTAGTPVLIYELMELALYRSEGRSWLGMRSLSSGEAIQPLFGPLAEEDGFRLDYGDASGLPTTVPAAVKRITVTLRGVPESPAEAAGVGMSRTEELTTVVALRNAGH